MPANYQTPAATFYAAKATSVFRLRRTARNVKEKLFQKNHFTRDFDSKKQSKEISI